MRAFCVACGAPYRREADEDWKTFCLPCFKKSKRPAEPIPTDSYWRDRATVAEQQLESLRATVSNLIGQSLRQPRQSGIDKELAEQLPRLLLVCHPDKHGGSQAATKVTQWLLDVRGRLPCA
jgi:hypothetical protein